MTIPQLMPWIGGPVKFEAGLSPLVCPIDETVASQIIESDAKIVDAAVKHAHAAFLKHQDATTAKRVEWLLAAADVIDKIEGELVRSLIRFIGKPRRAATFEAKRVGTFMRACAAQVPHLTGEVLPLDVTPAGAGRCGRNGPGRAGRRSGSVSGDVGRCARAGRGPGQWWQCPGLAGQPGHRAAPWDRVPARAK